MSSSFINYLTLNNEHNLEDLCIQLRINKHALPIDTTKSGEVRSTILFLVILHRRFASAMHVSLCKYNQ